MQKIVKNISKKQSNIWKDKLKLSYLMHGWSKYIGKQYSSWWINE